MGFAGTTPHLVRFFFLTLILAFVQAGPARSADTVATLLPMLKDVPGLSNLPVKDVKKTDTKVSAKVTLRGKTFTVVGMKVSSTYLGAVVPQAFDLTDVLPIPQGTPIQGVKFKDMAFVHLPKGQKKLVVHTNGFPEEVRKALAHSGKRLTLKEGLNVFGLADFSTSEPVRKILHAVGLNNLALPLNASFPANLFQHDPRSAAQNIKEQLLADLRLNLTLPKLRIPGLPSAIAIKDVGFMVVAPKIKGKPKREIFAGINGKLEAKLPGKTVDFNFYVLAEKPGAGSKKVTLKGDTKTTATISSFALTGLNLVAVRDGNKWSARVDARSKFKGKEVDLAVSVPASGKSKITIKTRMTLAELTGLNVPGLTDVALDDIEIEKDLIQAKAEIKKMEVDIASFKRGGKHLIAVATPKSLHISDLIPQIGKTPLDEVSFDHMTYVWAPKGTTIKGLKPSDLPPIIEPTVKQAAKSFDLEAGLNVVGQLGIKKDGNLGKLLSTVGAYKSSVALAGKLSPGVFRKGGNAGQIKNEILDNLDLHVPLPALKLPGVAYGVRFPHAELAITGGKDKGSRSITADVTGRLDFAYGSSKADFDFDAKLVRHKGRDRVRIDATEVPGTKLSLNLVEKFEFENMSFHLNNFSGKGWSANLSADTDFRGNKLDIAYIPASPEQPRHINVDAKGHSIAKLLGVPDLPGLSDIHLLSAQIYSGEWVFYADVKGVKSYILAEKASGGGYFVGVDVAKLSPAKFIPGAEHTPLKDVELEDMVLFHSPLKTAVSLDKSGLEKTLAGWIKGTVGNVSLKPGMNVFGHMVFKPEGELAKLLKQVGVHKVKLPLNGTVSPKALAKNLASVKNEILDNLDFKVPLPELKLPGSSGHADIKHASLSVKGKDAKGKRALTVDVKGRLDFAYGSSKADFDFDMKLVKKSGRNKVEIDAKQVPGTKLTIDMLEKFELTNMSLAMGNWAPGGWLVRLGADSKVNGTPIHLTYAHNPGASDLIEIEPKGLTIAKLVGKKGLPGLDDVALDSIRLYSEHNYLPAHYIVKGTVKGIRTSMQVQKAWSGGHFVAVTLGDIDLGKIIPRAANSPLKDVDFSNVAMVYSPANADVRLNKSGIVLNAQSWIQASNPNPVIRRGMNIYGHMDIKPSGELGKLLKEVGVTELKLPLNGGFSPKALAKNVSAQAIKNSILDHLDIDTNLPKLKIPGVGRHLTLKNDRLEIKGKLPDKKRGLSVKVASDAEIRVKNEDLAFFIEVDYDHSQGAQETDLEIKGHTDKPWNKPFGISFLDLEDLTLDVRKKTVNGTRTYDFDMAAKTDVGSHSKLDVKVDVHEKDGKLTDAFFELDGPLKLSDIPDVRDVPNASHFEIDTIKVSEHGIEAKTDFGGKKDLDAFLFHGSGWNLVLRQDNFSISEIVPPLGKTPLKHFKLSEAAIVISKDGLQGALDSFSPIAQDAMKDIFGAGTAHVDVDSGLSLIAAFEHKNAGGGLSGALKRLGLAEERVVLTGDVGGIFGGQVKFDVDVILSANPGATHQPKWMKSKPGVEAVFSLIANETAPAQFDIEIGIGTDVVASMHGTELDFTAKTALEFEDEKIDVKIVADLKDKKGWKHPFGIPGLTVYEVGFDLGIDAEGAIHMGFDGNVKISGDDYQLAFDADLEGGVIPTDLALIASADKVDFLFIEEIAAAMLGADFSLDMPYGILPTFTGIKKGEKLKFAFATPGAQDPDLNINGEGFAFMGAMNWLDHELGAMGLSINPTSGIAANGKIDDMKIADILELKNNHFDFKAGLKSIPSLKLNGDIDILNFKDRVEVDFGKKGVVFKSSASAGNAFKADVDFKLTGIDISAKHPEYKKADFYMQGDLHLDVGKFISGPAKGALDDIFKDMTAAFQAAEKVLKKAKAKVNDLTAKINAERAKVRKERAAAERRLQSAENRVNSLNNRINDDWGHYHHCHGWGKWACRAKWGIRIGGLKGARWVADEALRLAETLVAHFPIDLDPRVAVLIAERDTARVALDVALDAVKGADLMDKFLKDATDVVTSELGKAVNLDIKKASFAGDLKDIVSKDAPLLLGLDVEIYGVEFKENVAFKWKDVPYDVEQMGVMALHALERIVDDVLHWMPGSLKHKIRNHIASKMDAKQASAKRELAKYSTDFSAVAASQKAMQDRLAAHNVAFLQAQMSERKSPLDHDKSETFKNELIEVGHSGLCLNVYEGKVYQQPCNNNEERWTTSPASGADDVAPNSGYVYIKAGNGHCVVPEGKWAEVKKQFSDPKMPKEGSFTFVVKEFQGDGKIAVTTCQNSEEFYWKILAHGKSWMQMANRATSECLHFTHSSAKPGVAVAEWQPCVGSANQIYRIADSASPKYYPDYISLRNDQLGLCVGEANKDKTVPMVSCEKAAFYDYMVDIRGFAKFINYHTGHCLQPGGYAKGAKMTEVPCTQLDYQWWDAEAQAGGIIIKNAQTELCTNPPFNWAEVPPTQVDCAARNNAVFAPVRGKYRFTGPAWTVTTPETMPPANGRYKTKTGQNLCAFEVEGSFVPGVVIKHGGKEVCATAFTDASAPERFSKGKFRLMMFVQDDDMLWYPNSGKKLTRYNMPTGGFGGADEANIYTCRVPKRTVKHHINLGFGGGQNISWTLPSTVGWTADGKTCHVFNFSPAAGKHAQPPATEFDILSRWNQAYYQLQGSAAEDITQPTDVPDFPLPPPVKTAPVWIIGTDNSPYAWNPKVYGWIRQKGCLKQITVDGHGIPYGIQCDDYVVKWTGTEWAGIGGLKGLDVGHGGGWLYAIDQDGNPRPWVGKWIWKPTCAHRIDVLANGIPIIIGCEGKAKYLKGNDWIPMQGYAGPDIGTGNGQTPTWFVGSSHKHAWLWKGYWVDKGGCFSRIDVDGKGNPWGVGCDGGIFARDGSGWKKMPGRALDIGIKP